MKEPKKWIGLFAIHVESNNYQTIAYQSLDVYQTAMVTFRFHTSLQMGSDPLVYMAWKTKPRRCNQHNHKKLLISIMHLCYKIYLNVPQKRENLSLKGSVDLIWHESVRYFCSDRYKLDCGVRTMASQPSRCNKFKKDSKVKLAPKT